MKSSYENAVDDRERSIVKYESVKCTTYSMPLFRDLKMLFKHIKDDQDECLQVAAQELYFIAFGCKHEATDGPFFDEKDRIVWYWGDQPPKHHELPRRNIQGRYQIILEGQFLNVYALAKHRSKRRRLSFDLRDGCDRYGFLLVKYLIMAMYHIPDKTESRNKNLLRVQYLSGFDKEYEMDVEEFTNNMSAMDGCWMHTLHWMYDEGGKKFRSRFAGFELCSTNVLHEKRVTPWDEIEHGDPRQLSAFRQSETRREDTIEGRLMSGEDLQFARTFLRSEIKQQRQQEAPLRRSSGNEEWFEYSTSTDLIKKDQTSEPLPAECETNNAKDFTSPEPERAYDIAADNSYVSAEMKEEMKRMIATFSTTIRNFNRAEPKRG